MYNIAKITREALIETHFNKLFDGLCKLCLDVHLDVKNKIFLSKTNAYIDEFVNKEEKINSDLIEIHNRPSYVNSIKKNLNSKIIIYFHNDPLTMKGSISIKERKNLLNKCEKIIFNSKWCQSRFAKNLN